MLNKFVGICSSCQIGNWSATGENGNTTTGNVIHR